MLTISSACDFIMGFGKPQQRDKSELASPSRCRNIIGEPQPKIISHFALGVIL